MLFDRHLILGIGAIVFLYPLRVISSWLLNLIEHNFAELILCRINPSGRSHTERFLNGQNNLLRTSTLRYSLASDPFVDLSEQRAPARLIFSWQIIKGASS